MIRAVNSVLKLGKAPSNVVPGISNLLNFSTSSIDRSSTEGEPDFLQMVKIFADEAHSIALDKLLQAKPAPGKRQEEHSVREKHIKGIIFKIKDMIPILVLNIVGNIATYYLVDTLGLTFFSDFK